MKIFFKINLFIWLSRFQTQQLKSYSLFIFLIFDPSLVQNDFIFLAWREYAVLQFASWDQWSPATNHQEVIWIWKKWDRDIERGKVLYNTFRDFTVVMKIVTVRFHIDILWFKGIWLELVESSPSSSYSLPFCLFISFLFGLNNGVGWSITTSFLIR